MKKQSFSRREFLSLAGANQRRCPARRLPGCCTRAPTAAQWDDAAMEPVTVSVQSGWQNR